MLPTDTDAPNVTETTVRADLLQALEVVAELRVHAVGQDLAMLPVHDVLLPVQEPRGDLELRRVLHDRHYPLQLVRVQVARAESPPIDNQASSKSKSAARERAAVR